MKNIVIASLVLVLFLGSSINVFSVNDIGNTIESAKEKINKSNFKGAVKDLNIAIAEMPTNSEAYYYRAVANFNLRKNDEAIKDLEVAIALDHKQAKYYYMKAVAHADQDEFKKAYREMIKAIEIDNSNVEYYLLRADIEVELNYMTDAIQDWEKAASMGSVKAKENLKIYSKDV